MKINYSSSTGKPGVYVARDRGQNISGSIVQHNYGTNDQFGPKANPFRIPLRDPEAGVSELSAYLNRKKKPSYLWRNKPEWLKHFSNAISAFHVGGKVFVGGLPPSQLKELMKWHRKIYPNAEFYLDEDERYIITTKV